ncbi:MAG TPA: IPT/TIG domain-containing protein [Myxococcales bacterium]
MRPNLRLSSAFCLAGLLAVLGCDHKVESPAITADPEGTTGQPGPVAPDLVCTEQLLTALTISGDGFTPFPTQTLQQTVQLLLPTVELNRTKLIDGTTASGSVTVPDDVNDLAASHVRWFSEQKMGFDVYPELNVEPGLYSIKVTNRDDIHSAEFPNAFAAVPRPAISKVAPDILCDAQKDVTVTLTGSGFLDVAGALGVVHFQGKDFGVQSVDSCIEVPGPHSAGVVRTCTTAVFVLPIGSCVPTTAGASPQKSVLTLTNPSTAACTSTDSISITVAPPPGVASIVPDLICDAQGDQAMVISGTGFLQMGSTLPVVTVGTQTYNASALLECAELEGPFAEGVVKTCAKLQFTIGQGTLPPGKYGDKEGPWQGVTVTNPAPADCHSVEVLELTVVPPPTLTAIAPDLVCVAQGDQAMMLTGSDFLQVGAALPIVIVGDKTYNPSAAENCTPLDGTFAEGLINVCATLKFTIPAGDLPEGDYAVVVTNPPPANCSSSDLVNLHVAPPPTITGLGQGGICTAQADQTITVLGADFLQIGGTLPTVTINGVDYTPTSASGCEAVPGTFSEGSVQTCTGLSIVIPMGALTAGSYPVTVTNPDPAGCSTANATVSLKVVPPPAVTGVAPASICTNGGTLTLTGTDLGTNPTVTLTLAGFDDIAATNVSVNAAGTSLTVTLPPGAEPDTDYTILVNNGCDDTAPHKTVHIVPGPKLFFADPEVVYSGINTRVTLYVTSLNLPLKSVSITPSAGGPPIDLTYTVDASGRKVQVIIPADLDAATAGAQPLAPGEYDLSLADQVDCPATLAKAIRVTDSLTLSLKSVVPPFGWKSSNTDITIYRDTAAVAPADKPFIAVPRLFMNPANATGTEPAIQLLATSLSNADTLTSVVPKGSVVGTYDLIVVNPDGAVGILYDAFDVTDLPPPVITSSTPASIVRATGQTVTVAGTDFRGSTLSILNCADATGVPLATPATVTTTAASLSCTGSACTIKGVIDASMLTSDGSCVIQLTNDDGTWAIYSAIGLTGPSLNLSASRLGKPMLTGRRALVAAAGDATQAARFVYAIGGDSGGATPTVFDSVESAPVDVFGNMGDWTAQRYTLGAPRAFAAATQLGRYTYLCGGTDGTAILNSCKRAMILDPLEAPVLTVADLLVKDAGLDPGYWFYRVSATFSTADKDNPLGETLPADEIVVKVPALQDAKKVQIVLSWSAPVDSTNTTLPNISGYRIYRTAAVNGSANSEVLVATVGATTTQWTDDGTATVGTETFLPLGSTGTWADLPAMATPREGLGMTWAADPTTPNRFYVYSLSGKSTATTTALSYEILQVDGQANGHQVASAAWALGGKALPTGFGRWQFSAFRGDWRTAKKITDTTVTYVWIGGGLAADGTTPQSAKAFYAGKVAAGGDFSTFAEVNGFSNAYAGYGSCAANDQIFIFGGGGAAPDNGAKSALIGVGNAPGWPADLPPQIGGFNAGISMTVPRYLLGSAVQSAYIFLVGGQTGIYDYPAGTSHPASPASASTEIKIW